VKLVDRKANVDTMLVVVACKPLGQNLTAKAITGIQIILELIPESAAKIMLITYFRVSFGTTLIVKTNIQRFT